MMSDQPHKIRLEAPARRVGKTKRPAVEIKLPADVGTAASATAGPAAAGIGEPASSLTPDEQMALFAKELKENDWGHQPC